MVGELAHILMLIILKPETYFKAIVVCGCSFLCKTES